LYTVFFLFSFTLSSITDISPLSLHDALPIYEVLERRARVSRSPEAKLSRRLGGRKGSAPSEKVEQLRGEKGGPSLADGERRHARSEEHTSELQSPCNLVCRLLLEKKKETAAD